MDGKITLTEQTILNANDYIPLLEKQKMAETIAQKCVTAVKMTMAGNDGNKHALPNRFQEVQFLTSLYLMGIFAKLYLKIPYEGDNDTREDNPYYGLQMPANIYDRFAGSHVMNQLEHLKADKACRDKVFNILYDYRKLQRMLNAEIEIVLAHQNDVVWRLMASMELNVKEAMLGALEAQSEDGQTAAAETDAKKLQEARKKLDEFKSVQEKMAKVEEKLREKLDALEVAAQKEETEDA